MAFEFASSHFSISADMSGSFGSDPWMGQVFINVLHNPWLFRYAVICWFHKRKLVPSRRGTMLTSWDDMFLVVGARGFLHNNVVSTFVHFWANSSERKKIIFHSEFWFIALLPQSAPPININ